MPELFLYRHPTTEVHCHGDYMVGTEFICHSLEDMDRGLDVSMPILEITQKKVFGKTAIPYGRYEFEWYYSPKHGWVPLLFDVPGFTMIEIHAANRANELQGCQAPITTITDYGGSESRKAKRKLYELILHHNIRYINIQKK